MVRPAAFGWNAETEDSNRFQARSALPAAELAECARQEFDAMVASLRQAGVTVHVFDDHPVPICPDAVFPNNWVSFHDDGTVVLYPMLAPSRRRERRPELLQELIRQGGYALSRLLDLSHHELAGRYLEGTGSMVLDHVARIAYACPSPRTHPAVLQEFCEALGFEPCSFEAADRGGTAVYHTNVLLAIGGRFAVICSEAVAERDRARVRGRLADSGRTLVEIGFEQLEYFAGNMLELRAADGVGVLVMSAQARAGLDARQLETLLGCVDRLVVPPVHHIEQAGGGSVRCMIAEVFLPAQTREVRPPV
jgi:hypothetical protein